MKNLKKSLIEYNNETNSDIAESNGSMIHLFEECHTVQERKQKIDSVTIDQVNEFAKRIANENMFNIVAVGKNVNEEDLKVY